MVGGLLLRGMLAGLLAGLLAFGLAWYLGEPQVERAIGLEEQLSGGGHLHGVADVAAAHEHDQSAAVEEELVSRGVQSTLGLLTGVIVYGIGLGGLFSLVFAYAYGRVGPMDPRTLAALLAAAAFLVIYLVPSLKYPANPPAVGQGETIGIRTGLFFTMMVFSLAAAAAAVAIGRRLAVRLGCWNGAILAGILFVVVVAVGQAFLPDINEVPDEFPAVLLWRFRVASLFTQVLLWGGIGLIFGYLADRFLAEARGVPGGKLAHQT